jgi:hypothetical protein
MYPERWVQMRNSIYSYSVRYFISPNFCPLNILHLYNFSLHDTETKYCRGSKCNRNKKEIRDPELYKSKKLGTIYSSLNVFKVIDIAPTAFSPEATY